jgi:hypothetical protein
MLLITHQLIHLQKTDHILLHMTLMYMNTVLCDTDVVEKHFYGIQHNPWMKIYDIKV